MARIAVFNGDADLLEGMGLALTQAGHVVIMRLATIEGPGELARFVGEHEAEAVVYDVMPPYEASLRRLEEVCSAPELCGRPIVLTTTAAPYQFRLPSCELAALLWRPFAFDDLVAAVEQALPQ